MFRSIVVALAVSVCLPSVAAAFCNQPSPPSRPFATKPSAPYCGNFGDLSGCDQWDIDRYRSDLKQYIEAMGRYADEVNDYADEGIRYANCEIDQSVDDWNRFIGK